MRCLPLQPFHKFPGGNNRDTSKFTDGQQMGFISTNDPICSSSNGRFEKYIVRWIGLHNPNSFLRNDELRFVKQVSHHRFDDSR